MRCFGVAAMREFEIGKPDAFQLEYYAGSVGNVVEKDVFDRMPHAVPR